MKYEVLTVADGELPVGLDHVIVERDNGDPPLLIVSERPAQVWRFMRKWEDLSEPPAHPSVLLRAV